ncbi:nuclear transport factor 2 family protein [Pseudonocardia sp. NPDC049154]|uniref:nuclear transport factor 2 family protein n=1 Tax=Pseudonocardia sp. NPDC049154 TaxID=3155501 RepID=UPI0033CB7785
MTRVTPPTETDIAQRLDRVESQLAIRDLAARYALAVDSRDLDSLAELFVADVDNGRAGKGRGALRTWFGEVLTGFYRSMHFVSGHVVDLVDSDYATGSVYCRAEHEDGDAWVVMAIRYLDTYRRDDGVWYFERRRLQPWYVADALEHPQDAAFSRWPGREQSQPARLPKGFPTWEPFWEGAGSAVRVSRTAQP